MNSPFLSIVIPAFNEEKRIGKTLEEVAAYLESSPFPAEIIVVDDGSIDNTVKISKEIAQRCNLCLQVIQNDKNEGKGFAVKRGVLSANGDYIMFMDADHSTSIKELEKFLPWLQSGYDVVIGSRKTEGASILLHQPWYRENMGKVFTILANSLLRLNVSDITCGFKCFSNSAAQNLFSRQILKDWSFDAEILFLARQLGFRIKEIPVSWKDTPNTRVRLVKDAWKSLLGFLKIKLNQWKGLYSIKT